MSINKPFAAVMILAAAAAALSLATSKGRAITAKDTCPAVSRSAEIAFNAPRPEVVVDRTLSTDDLGRLLKERTGSEGVAFGDAVTGLTVQALEANIEAEFSVGRTADRRPCLWPVRIVPIVRSHGPIMVYVNREYQRGSCQEQAVIRHEFEHVKIYQDSVVDVIPKLQKALEEASHDVILGEVGQSADSLRLVAISRLNDAFRSVIDEMDEERLQSNAALDTAENYAAIKTMCSKW